MISFRLACDKDHVFDGWFTSSADFEAQNERGLIQCPQCGSAKVEKTLMAPAVSTARKKETIAVASMDQARSAALKELKELRDKVVENSDNVGKNFPEEARKIHYGESDNRSIYGEASREDVESLLEEGVEIAPLPVLPDDAH